MTSPWKSLALFDVDKSLEGHVGQGIFSSNLWKTPAYDLYPICAVDGAYDTEYMTTHHYDELEMDLLSNVIPTRVWGCLSQTPNYEPCLLKASFFVRLAHRYLHALIACSLTVWADSIKVVGWQSSFTSSAWSRATLSTKGMWWVTTLHTKANTHTP